MKRSEVNLLELRVCSQGKERIFLIGEKNNP